MLTHPCDLVRPLRRHVRTTSRAAMPQAHTLSTWLSFCSCIVLLSISCVASCITAAVEKIKHVMLSMQHGYYPPLRASARTMSFASSAAFRSLVFWPCCLS